MKPEQSKRMVQVTWRPFPPCCARSPPLHTLTQSSSTFPPLPTCAEVGRINDRLNLWRKVMNNVYVLIIHGGQPSTQTTAPLEITGSPRQHKLSITFQSGCAAQETKAEAKYLSAKYGCLRSPASRTSRECATLMTAHVAKIHATYRLSCLFKNDTAAIFLSRVSPN